jgi:signal transduction histidine kinase
MAENNILQNKFNVKRPQNIYILYWFLLSYILAALFIWFILLNRQNLQISQYRLDLIDVDDSLFPQKQMEIINQTKRNTLQYIGEGVFFLILIAVGAVFVFRAIKRQFVLAQQQENFMMAITHELKTPVAVTKLNLETLQRRNLTDEQRKRLITTTIQETNRLNSLCNNMLLSTQIESGGQKLIKEQINFTKVLKKSAEEFAARFPLRKIETEFTQEVFINGDLLLLQLAVNNLLDNALKYSRKDSIVLLRLLQINKEVQVQVIDEGPGISSEDKEKIFEKYYRGSKEKTKGTGLGLYITKKILKAHQGDIKIYNNPNGGSIFEMILKEQKM